MKRKNKKDIKPVIKLPYPQRVTKKDPSESYFEKLMTMLKKIESHMSLFEALERMPMYKKYMEEVMAGKKPTTEELVALKEKCSANSLGQKNPNKQKDPGAVTVSCKIKERTFKKVLIDSGASVSLMPLSIYHKLGIKNVSDTKTNLKFTNHSTKDAYGIAEDILVTIEDLSFPIDFVILDIPEDKETPIILGRPFMQTSRCNLGMDQGMITLKVYDKEITLNAIENHELEIEKEHHYQVGLTRTEVRRQSNAPTSEKDTRRPSQASPPPLATPTPSSSPNAQGNKQKSYPQGRGTGRAINIVAFVDDYLGRVGWADSGSISVGGMIIQIAEHFGFITALPNVDRVSIVDCANWLYVSAYPDTEEGYDAKNLVVGEQVVLGVIVRLGDDH
ncbi:uncharacterized protein LOC127122500 [Lathyrus oleraceus]|uniref:uncharacterized protein LOC127122500 n=1 Tax=Pisum sativum TaxID=3888 RepID=UPI0021D0D29E|nr:uncharacterized protein LOC127122500 [Pisum sativum]